MTMSCAFLVICCMFNHPETMKSVAVFIVCVLSVCFCEGKKCNVPPEFWCSSPELAADCQVTEQCKQYYSNQRIGAADKVNFTLYFESNCPDCKNFFREQLSPNFEKLRAIMNLTLVPYGNAREEKTVSGKWKFTCQHGEEECVGNLIETCAIHLLQNITAYFPFIACIEDDQFGVPEKDAKKCAKKLGVDFQSIMDCANGNLGNSLEHQMAVRTDSLDPPHKYVPWVTLNGVHTEEIQNKAQQDLVKLICDTYKGEKPDICRNHIKKRCDRF